jgi:hypothetical protein
MERGRRRQGTGIVGAGKRRTRLIVVGVAVLVLAAGGAVAWFQPQKLFIDQRVDEAPPGAGTRLDRYRSVVIWCRRFTYAFGAAELSPIR